MCASHLQGIIKGTYNKKQELACMRKLKGEKTHILAFFDPQPGEFRLPSELLFEFLYYFLIIPLLYPFSSTPLPPSFPSIIGGWAISPVWVIYIPRLFFH